MKEELLTLLETDARQTAASNPVCAIVYCSLLGLSSFENTYDNFVNRLEEMKSENHLLEIQDLESIDNLVSSGARLAEYVGDGPAESILSALQQAAGKTPLASALYGEIMFGLAHGGPASSRELVAPGAASDGRGQPPLTPSTRKR